MPAVHALDLAVIALYFAILLGIGAWGAAAIGPKDSLTVSVAVTNAGARAADEVVQLYVRDEVASVTRPVRALAAFRRVSLAPGETRTVALRLTPERLGLYDRAMRFVVEPGTFRVFVGPNSAEGLEGTFVVRAPAGP
jgi:beta-glucosidase